MLGSVSDITVTSRTEWMVQMPLQSQGWSEPFSHRRAWVLRTGVKSSVSLLTFATMSTKSFNGFILSAQYFQ